MNVFIYYSSLFSRSMSWKLEAMLQMLGCDSNKSK